MSKVADRSKASEAMLNAAAKGRALMGGTTAMRAAGQTYLPKFEAESHEAYEARLKSSWLFNGYRKTSRDMTGRVFDKPVELAEGASQRLIDWCMNVDMQGRDLSTFAREIFEDGLSGCGVSYIMVDAPPRRGVVTREQAQAGNLRPYLVHLRVEDVLGWRAETIDNVTTLTQIRIMESVTEQDPKDEFNEVEISQVRVLDLIEGTVYVRLFRKNSADVWAQYEETYASEAKEITVIPFYANRTGFFKGAPLLDDLADVNIAHWQSQSDQRNILHFARVPILFGSGRSEEEPIVIAAGMAVTATDPQADLKWVEHSGQAIGAGRQDLKDLEFQMETHGLQLLVTSGAQSATGEVLDAKKETSTLAMTADALKDALEQALIWMAEYGGEDVTVEVNVNKEFGASLLTAQDVTALLSAVNTGNLSKVTFLRELARRGFIRDDLQPDDEIEAIETESPDLNAGAADGFGQ